MVILHLSASILALLAIAAVFMLPKGRGAHRQFGRTAAVALLVSALSSFGIHYSHYSWIHLLSVVMLINLPYAVWQARRGRIGAHRRAMLFSAGGLVTAGLAATFAPGRLLHGLLFG